MARTYARKLCARDRNHQRNGHLNMIIQPEEFCDRPFCTRSSGRPGIDRQMLAAQAEELGKTIPRLTGMRDRRWPAAASRAPSHMECPTLRGIRKPPRPVPFVHEEKECLTTV